MPSRYDVFLSYSSADETAVEEIARKLEAKGIKPFLDKWHLIPGKVWQEELESALEDSGACAIFIGSEGLGPWAKQEMRVVLDRGARDSDFPVIPVLLPGVKKPTRLPSFLRQRTWVEFGANLDDEGALHRLIAGIRGEAPGSGDSKPSLPISGYPEGFVYRREYDRVIEALCVTSGDNGATVGITTAIRGAGGFGKTALAEAILQDKRVLQLYPDGIEWITMGENIDNQGRLSCIRDLIRRRTGQSPAFETVGAAGVHLRELLAGRKVLLVIDDVWSPVDLTPFLGMGPGTALLVTTRDIQTLPVSAKRIEVDAMTSKEAISLLQLGLPEGERRAVQDLARHLREWPLLLCLVNRQLRDRIHYSGLTLAEAIQEVEEDLASEGLTVFDHRDSEERRRAVSKTINVSLKRLEKEDSEYPERYRRLAVFPEDVLIPLSVLERLWDLSRIEVRRLCGCYYDLSLLREFDRRSERIRIHDVIRQFLIRQWGNEISRVHKCLLNAYPAWPELPRDEEYLWRQLSYHLLAAGRSKELRDMLLNFDYLRAKLEMTDVNALLGDFDELSRKDEEVRLIQAAIRMSAHILAKRTEQLAPHLLGRLLGGETAGIKHLLEQGRKASYLRPRAPSFRPPGPLLRTIEVGSSITALAVVGDRRAVSGYVDGRLQIFDLETGQILRILEGHSDRIWAVAKIDSQRAISGSSDGTLRIWDLEIGQTLRTLEGYNVWVTTVAVVDGRRAVSGFQDGILRVLDLETGQTMRTLEGHNDWVTTVAIVDGRLAVSGSEDGTLRVWDLEAGESLRTLKGHNNWVTVVAVVDDQRAVSGSSDGTLRVWDLNTGQTLQTLKGHNASVRAVAVVDGCRVISGSQDGILRVWDLETGKTLRILEGHNDWVTAMALTMVDSRRVASASSDGTLRVWDLETGQTLRILEGHNASVRAVAVVDDRRAISGSADGTLRVWDLETGHTLRTLKGHKDSVRAVTVVDGRCAVSGSNDGTLRVWDLETGQTLRTLEGHNDWVRAVAVIDSRRAISGSNDGTLRVWDLETGHTLRILKGHNDWVWAVAVVDSRRAVSGSNDGTLRVWDLETGHTLRTLEGHNEWIWAVAVVDGQRAISGSADRTLRVWDLETGHTLRTLEGHSAWVRTVAVVDDRRVVSGSADGTLRVWDLETGKCLAVLVLEAAVTSVAIAPDHRTVVAGDESGRVHFLELDVDALN